MREIGPSVAGGFTTLVYEPVYNGTVIPGEWQNWNAYNNGDGKWWSTRDITGACAFDCFVPWSTITSNNPDAVILGGFGVNQGSGNPNVVSAVDNLTIGYQDDVIKYDFEIVIATSKDQCKAGGWAFIARTDDSPFNNQGDCVSYVTTGQ